MTIVSRPRQIRIELDPDKGFPVSIRLESSRYAEESGEVQELRPHVDPLEPGSEQAKAVLGDVLASATEALAVYQAEVQRLGLLLRAHGIQF